MKKDIIIGFDFDKIFIDTPPLIPNKLIDFLYKGGSYFNRGGKSHLHYRYPGSFEQKIRILSHYSLFRPTIQKNIDVLRKISNKKSGETYLVSSRFSFLKKRTDAILQKYNLTNYFDGIYFNYENLQPHLFKEETIRKLKIDTYIDDDLDLSLYLSKKIPELKIYWVTDGRNKEVELPANITAIKNLESLEKYL